MKALLIHEDLQMLASKPRVIMFVKEIMCSLPFLLSRIRDERQPAATSTGVYGGSCPKHGHVCGASLQAEK